jgi:hypothetical protein
MKKYVSPAQRYYRTKGQRHYEITNHLGNVMATISDRKLGQSPDNDTLINYYHADLLSAQDYYPGGMLMPGRSYSSDSYRFGFNGQEKTNEISGSGNHYSAQFWEMDPRIGRRWERDPVVKHHESPYAILGNNPIWFVDLNGADSSLYNSGTGAFIAKGVTPQDDKTAIWTVDPTAKGYDKDNPWKTAQKLTYSVGKDQKKEVGKNNLRRNHPLAGKGWTYGGQVFEEDLLDMTRDFTGIVNQWMPYFTRNGKEWDKAAQDCLDSWLCALNPNGYTDFLLGKKVAFVGMVGPNMPFDLKSRSRGNLQQIPSYAAIVIGQYSLYRGRLMGYDDYGNAAFGAWGRAYGFGISTLTQGADIDQIFHSGSSDPDRDQYFIKFGFNLLK